MNQDDRPAVLGSYLAVPDAVWEVPAGDLGDLLEVAVQRAVRGSFGGDRRVLDQFDQLAMHVARSAVRGDSVQWRESAEAALNAAARRVTQLGGLNRTWEASIGARNAIRTLAAIRPPRIGVESAVLVTAPKKIGETESADLANAVAGVLCCAGSNVQLDSEGRLIEVSGDVLLEIVENLGSHALFTRDQAWRRAAVEALGVLKRGFASAWQLTAPAELVRLNQATGYTFLAVADALNALLDIGPDLAFARQMAAPYLDEPHTIACADMVALPVIVTGLALFLWTGDESPGPLGTSIGSRVGDTLDALAMAAWSTKDARQANAYLDALALASRRVKDMAKLPGAVRIPPDYEDVGDIAAGVWRARQMRDAGGAEDSDLLTAYITGTVRVETAPVATVANILRA